MDYPFLDKPLNAWVLLIGGSLIAWTVFILTICLIVMSVWL